MVGLPVASCAASFGWIPYCRHNCRNFSTTGGRGTGPPMIVCAAAAKSAGSGRPPIGVSRRLPVAGSRSIRPSVLPRRTSSAPPGINPATNPAATAARSLPVSSIVPWLAKPMSAPPAPPIRPNGPPATAPCAVASPTRSPAVCGLNSGTPASSLREFGASLPGMRSDTLLQMLKIRGDQRAEWGHRIRDKIDQPAESSRCGGHPRSCALIGVPGFGCPRWRGETRPRLTTLEQRWRHRLLRAGEVVIDLGIGETGLLQCRALFAGPLADLLLARTRRPAVVRSASWRRRNRGGKDRRRRSHGRPTAAACALHVSTGGSHPAAAATRRLACSAGPAGLEQCRAAAWVGG